MSASSSTGCRRRGEGLFAITPAPSGVTSADLGAARACAQTYLRQPIDLEGNWTPMSPRSRYGTLVPRRKVSACLMATMGAGSLSELRWWPSLCPSASHSHPLRRRPPRERLAEGSSCPREVPHLFCPLLSRILYGICRGDARSRCVTQWKT